MNDMFGGIYDDGVRCGVMKMDAHQEKMIGYSTYVIVGYFFPLGFP